MTYINDDTFSYTLNSEIDKTIPHLDVLIEETKKQKKDIIKKLILNIHYLKY